MPGGGLESNESSEDAARREAYEESGCTFELGPYVWFRHDKHIWNGKPFDQYERFFVAFVSDYHSVEILKNRIERFAGPVLNLDLALHRLDSFFYTPTHMIKFAKNFYRIHMAIQKSRR